MRSGVTTNSRILDVFLSTTAGDLSAYRDAVHEALTDTGIFFVTSQKNMTAHDAQAEIFCRDKVKAADIFVGLVGMRRGWEPDGDNSQRSITEIEHDVAKDSARRRYIWVTPDNFPVPGNLHETRAEHRRQLSFRKRIMASGERIVSQKGFNSPEQLAGAIVTHLLKEVVSGDLIKLLRPEFGGPAAAEEQKPAIAAAFERLAQDDDIDLLALAKNPKGIDIAKLEAKLTARAELHAAEGRRENKTSAEYWRHIGALSFLHNTQKALSAYGIATTLDPDEAEGWSQLGRLQYRLGEVVLAEQSFNIVVRIGQRTNNEYAESTGLTGLGWIFDQQGKLDSAEEMYLRALALYEKHHSKKGMAATYSNLGIIHSTRGKLDKGEEMHKMALKLDEELGNKEGMAANYANLGIIYKNRGNLAKAEDMHNNALRLHEDLGDREGMAADYGNLGVIYNVRHHYDKAEEIQLKALKLNEELGRKEGMALAYGNLGVIHSNRDDLGKAEQMHLKALALDEELGSKGGMARHLWNLSLIYEKKGNDSQLCECLRKARDLWREMGLAKHVADVQRWMKKAKCKTV